MMKSVDDINYDNSMNSRVSDLNQLTNENKKLWVTVNYCGNAKIRKLKKEN